MPEPTQDPEVAQVLSAIRQLIDQSRTPARPPPLLLTPELRVGSAEPGLAPAAPAPQGLPLAGASDPLPTGPSVTRGGPAALAGPVQDAPSGQPSPFAPKADAAGGLLVLERPILPGAAAPSRAPTTPLPVLILGTPEPAHDRGQPSGSDLAHTDPRPEPVIPEGHAAADDLVPPSVDWEALPSLPPDAAPELAESPIHTREGATPAAGDLLPDQDGAGRPVTISGGEFPREDPVPAPLTEGAAAQDDPPSPAIAGPEDEAGQSPAPEASGMSEPAAPPAPAFDLPDLSAFMPLAGLPPSITLLGRRPPEPPAAPPEPVAKDVEPGVPDPSQSDSEEPVARTAPPEPAAMDAPPEVPDLSQAGSEEPAAWTEPDWPELRNGTDRPDPAALPEDDFAGLLPADEPEDTETPAPDDALRERVVHIVREEVRRELGDLREVVRQEVRDVLAERDRP